GDASCSACLRLPRQRAETRAPASSGTTAKLRMSRRFPNGARRRSPKRRGTMTGTVVAAVPTGDQQLELQEFPRPSVGADDALLRVEGCGICGSDNEQFRGDLAHFKCAVTRAPA